MLPNPPNAPQNTQPVWGQMIVEKFVRDGAFSNSIAVQQAHEEFRRRALTASQPPSKAVWGDRRNALALWALISIELNKPDETLDSIIACLDRRHDSWQGQLIFTLFAYHHNCKTNIVPSQFRAGELVIAVPIMLLQEIQRELLHVICGIGLSEGLEALRTDRLDIDFRTVISRLEIELSTQIPAILSRTLFDLASLETDEALFLLRLFALVNDEAIEASADRGFFLAEYFLGYSWPLDDYRAFALFRDAAGVYMSEKDFNLDRNYGHVLSYIFSLDLVLETDLPTSSVRKWSDWIPRSHLALLCDVVDDAAAQMKSAPHTLDATSSVDNGNA